MRLIIFQICKNEYDIAFATGSIISFATYAREDDTALLVSLVHENDELISVKYVKNHYSNCSFDTPIMNKMIALEDLDSRDWLAPVWYEEAKAKVVSSMLKRNDFLQ